VGTNQVPGGIIGLGPSHGHQEGEGASSLSEPFHIVIFGVWVMSLRSSGERSRPNLAYGKNLAVDKLFILFQPRNALNTCADMHKLASTGYF